MIRWYHFRWYERAVVCFSFYLEDVSDYLFRKMLERVKSRIAKLRKSTS